MVKRVGVSEGGRSVGDLAEHELNAFLNGPHHESILYGSGYGRDLQGFRPRRGARLVSTPCGGMKGQHSVWGKEGQHSV